MSAEVNVTRRDAIATLEIDGRTDLNLPSAPGVFEALMAQVERCGQDESLRAIILRGRGRSGILRRR